MADRQPVAEPGSTPPPDPPQAAIDDKLISAAASALARKFGSGTFLKLGDPKSYPDVRRVIHTGVMDSVIGARTLEGEIGFPLGKLVEIWGPPSAGKSTVSKIIVAAAQKQGVIPYWQDAEVSGVQEFDQKLGIEWGKGFVTQGPFTLEEAFQHQQGFISTMRDLKQPGLVVLDSLAATPLKSQIKREFGDKAPMGEKAAFLAMWLPKLVDELIDTDVGILIINHQREDPDAAMFQETAYAPGGLAKDHWMHVRLKISRIAWYNKTIKGETVRSGIDSEIKCVKNKLATPWKSCKMRIIWDTGEVLPLV